MAISDRDSVVNKFRSARLGTTAIPDTLEDQFITNGTIKTAIMLDSDLQYIPNVSDVSLGVFSRELTIHEINLISLNMNKDDVTRRLNAINKEIGISSKNADVKGLDEQKRSMTNEKVLYDEEIESFYLRAMEMDYS